MKIDIENSKNNNDEDLKYTCKEKDIQVLDLKITENISKIGITEFAIFKHECEHIITFAFNNNRRCHITFLPKKISMTNLLKEIKKKLLQTLGPENDYKVFNPCLNDIENQIIDNRNKIFSISSKDASNNKNKLDSFNSIY